MKTSLRINDKISIGTIRIKDNVAFYLLCIISLFPFFEPRIFFNYGAFHMIDLMYMGLQVLLFCVLFIRYVLDQKISFGFIGLAMYRVSVLACTLLTAHTIDTGWFSKTLIIMGAEMAIELFIRRDALKTLNCLYVILLVPLVINLFMCLLGIHFSGGGTHYYFIGMRTQFPNTMIPAIILAMLTSYMSKNVLVSPRVVFTIVICIIQLLKEWVGTGLVLILLMGCAIFFFIRKPNLFYAPVCFLMTLVLNFGVAVLRIQNIFSFIIVDMMHKDLTLTGRTSIWDVVIKKISQSPWLGHGELGTGGIVRVHWADRLVPAHNSMLQIIYDGGLISFAILVIYILYACFRLQKYKDSRIACVLGVGILLNGVQMITEVVQYQIYFYLFFILACNVHYIMKSNTGVGDGFHRLTARAQ